MRRRDEHKSNHDRWLVSWADFITLLFAFFVVMYSVSNVSDGKYRVLATTLDAIFVSKVRSLQNVQAQDPTAPDYIQPDRNPGLEKIDAERLKDVDPDLDALANSLSQLLDDLILSDKASLNVYGNTVELELKADILFPLRETRLFPYAKQLLTPVAQALSMLTNPIEVEGFTDNIPMKNTGYASNWEFSAARAGSVWRELMAQGISPDRGGIAGYGPAFAVADNSTFEGRAANQRIVIVIKPKDANSRLLQGMHTPELQERLSIEPAVQIKAVAKPDGSVRFVVDEQANNEDIPVLAPGLPGARSSTN